MTRLLRLAALGVAALLAWPLAAQTPSEHSVFQKYVGEWTAEGSLTVIENGSEIAVDESWQGSFDSEGRLVIEGRRTIGDNEHTFQWTVFYNATSELYEANYTASDSENEQSWQISVSDVESVVEMLVTAENGSGSIQVRSVVGDGEIESLVKALDGAGTETIKGVVRHTRSDADASSSAKEAGED